MFRFVWVTFLCAFLFVPIAQAETNSRYDHIVSTRTLRCGYVVYPPSITKDPNTGKMSGLMYDITESLGSKLGFKIDWAEEVTFGTMIEGLKANKYDLLCLNGWDTAHLAPYVMNARPLFYSVINPFVRQGDTRFDNKQESLNNASVKFSAIDGQGTTVIAQQTFPKASLVSMSQDTPYSLSIQNVVDKKADVVLVENALAAEYIKSNPGKIQQVKLKAPLRYYANSLMVGTEDTQLLNMLNAALNEMVGSGEIDRILEKYNQGPPFSYLKVADPYK